LNLVLILFLVHIFGDIKDFLIRSKQSIVFILWTLECLILAGIIAKYCFDQGVMPLGFMVFISIIYSVLMRKVKQRHTGSSPRTLLRLTLLCFCLDQAEYQYLFMGVLGLNLVTLILPLSFPLTGNPLFQIFENMNLSNWRHADSMHFHKAQKQVLFCFIAHNALLGIAIFNNDSALFILSMYLIYFIWNFAMGIKQKLLKRCE
jgi:hypothetical protein